MTKTADLERSKRLKSAGCKQEGDFYFVLPCQSHGMIQTTLVYKNENLYWRKNWNQEYVYVAPTAGEMIEWLLGEGWTVEIAVDYIAIQEQDPLGKCKQIFYKDNFVNALADAVIWVLEKTK